MKKDLVIGIVGTAILVTAMIGVFRFEAAQSGTSFDVRFPTNQTVVEALSQRTDEGAPTAATYNLTLLNATRIEWVLAWTDDTDNTAQDELQITVTSPTGETKETREADGEIVVAFDGLNAVPPEQRLTGSDASAATARAAALFTAANGTGVWNLTIAVLSTGNAVPDQAPLPVLRDTGNEWTLVARVTRYAAELTPA